MGVKTSLQTSKWWWSLSKTTVGISRKREKSIAPLILSLLIQYKMKSNANQKQCESKGSDQVSYTWLFQLAWISYASQKAVPSWERDAIGGDKMRKFEQIKLLWSKDWKEKQKKKYLWSYIHLSLNLHSPKRNLGLWAHVAFISVTKLATEKDHTVFFFHADKFCFPDIIAIGTSVHKYIFLYIYCSR